MGLSSLIVIPQFSEIGVNQALDMNHPIQQNSMIHRDGFQALLRSQALYPAHRKSKHSLALAHLEVLPLGQVQRLVRLLMGYEWEQ
jgi:hypothetical protein